jgi:trimethylamine--corrinoid protein Co-methyltransferase
MHTGNGAYGAVELGLINAGTSQIAKFYQIPMFSSGGLTESKISDAQAGVEKALQILTVALAGGNYIHQASGALDSILTCNYEQDIIDNEMLGMVARILDGIKVNSDTLSFEQIKTVGPGGTFIELRHTLNHICHEHYLPQLFDRNSYDTWAERGAKDIQEQARGKAREILTTHKVPPLDVDVQKELAAIILNAENTYGS